MKYIRFTAEVNGRTRDVAVAPEDLAQGFFSASYLVKEGEGFDVEDLLDQIELVVMNTETYYLAFYRGAADADYDAYLTNRTAEWVEL